MYLDELIDGFRTYRFGEGISKFIFRVPGGGELTVEEVRQLRRKVGEERPDLLKKLDEALGMKDVATAQLYANRNYYDDLSENMKEWCNLYLVWMVAYGTFLGRQGKCRTGDREAGSQTVGLQSRLTIMEAIASDANALVWISKIQLVNDEGVAAKIKGLDEVDQVSALVEGVVNGTVCRLIAGPLLVATGYFVITRMHHLNDERYREFVDSRIDNLRSPDDA